MLYLALNNVLLYPHFNSHLYLEIRIGQLVGEASAANSDSGKHTVALVLVHDKPRLHTSRLLVGVGHHATDEVGLGLVEGGHQVVQLALEVGGHGLAALALLTVLVLGSLQGLAWVVGKALDGLQETQWLIAQQDNFCDNHSLHVMASEE